MPLNEGELKQLKGVLPPLFNLAVALKQEATLRLRIDLVIPAFGGLRTKATQAQLVRWRDEAVERARKVALAAKKSPAEVDLAGKRAYYQVAPFGKSRHELGGAFDVKIVPPAEATSANYLRLGKLGESLGLDWGGRWKGRSNDPFHFQLPLPWLTLKAEFASHTASQAVVVAQTEQHPKHTLA